MIEAEIARVGIEGISIAILTVGELYFGAYNSACVEANIARVRSFLSHPGPTVLPMDISSLEYFGKFKAMLKQSGRPIGDMDLLIAGIAASSGLTVVTNNTEHFGRLPEIAVENWLRSAGPPA